MAGATTVREAIASANHRFEAAFDGGDRAGRDVLCTENLPVMPPGTLVEGLTSVVVWKRQPGGIWWPHADIWNADTERDDVTPPRQTRPTSRSISR